MLQNFVIFATIFKSLNPIYAKIAQLVEQPLRKRQVRGSIPRLGYFFRLNADHFADTAFLNGQHFGNFSTAECKSAGAKWA